MKYRLRTVRRKEHGNPFKEKIYFVIDEQVKFLFWKSWRTICMGEDETRQLYEKEYKPLNQNKDE
jgi:hypothetical protein